MKDERTALIALYDTTGGTNWNEKRNWKTNRSVSEWYGVETNSYGQVIGLALLYNKLSGPIPVELAQLSNLKYLMLDGNELSGPIPVELAQLHNLESLLLADNAGLYAPADTKFQAWLTNLKEFSVDDSDQAEAQPPPESPRPAPARDDVLLSDVERDEGNDVSLGTIERLLDAVNLPDDPTQALELLESFLRLAETLNKKVGGIGDGAANMRIFAASVEKLQDDLTKTEKTIAEVAKQTEDAAQQQSELDTKNATLEAELEDKTKELEARNVELDTKNKELEDKKAAFEERYSDREKVEGLLAELESEIPRVEAAIQEVNDKNADVDFALRVDDTGQKFHDAVEGFLQSQRQGFGIMGQIGYMLRLHHGDDAQILEALKQWEDLESANLNTAIDLVDEIAENLGDLDRCLGALTKERDSTS